MSTTEDSVVVAIKTPVTRNPVIVTLPRELSLVDAISALRDQQYEDPDSAHVVQQIERELRASPEYFAVREGGEITVVKSPESTSLADVAISREVRSKTDGTIKVVPAAAIHIQSYAPVGS